MAKKKDCNCAAKKAADDALRLGGYTPKHSKSIGERVMNGFIAVFGVLLLAIGWVFVIPYVLYNVISNYRKNGEMVFRFGSKWFKKQSQANKAAAVDNLKEQLA